MENLLKDNELYCPPLPVSASAYCAAPKIDYSSPTDFYQNWAKTNFAQTIVLSGTATPTEFKQWEASLPSTDDALLKAESYCRARLVEIRKINDAHHSLTAFTVIPAFIGFLSSIAISRNYYLRQKVGRGGSKRYAEDRVCDECQFRCFVRRFMIGEKHYVKRSRIDSDERGLDWVLYKIVRCGLVHRYSLSNARKHADHERLFDVCITHSTLDTDINEIDKMLRERPKRGRIQVLVSASSLCDWIEAGLNRMFDKEMPKGFKHSLLVNFRKSTPVSFISTH